MEVSGYTVEVLGGKHFSGNEQVPSYQMHFPWSVNMNKYDKSYVELVDGQPYQIQMRNSHPTRCNARVMIDGKHVGTWRLGPHRTISIERPANVDKKFTFYRVGSSGGDQAGLQRRDPNNGLIQVEFVPERNYQYEAVVNNPFLAERELSMNGRGTTNSNLLASTQSYMADGSYDEGGTGLHGRSHQQFDRAGPMELNYSNKVVVSLRLVARKEPIYRDHQDDRWHDTITPLGQPKSNPIPPPMY